MSQEVEFSKSSIALFLDDPAGYNETRSTGKPRILRSQDEFRITRTLQACLSSFAVLADTL